MKINKLIENTRLIEDIDLTDINPKTASVAELADAINDAVTDFSDGERELPDEVATEVAEITKDAALQVNAGSVAIVIDDKDYNSVEIKNALSDTLDLAYATAKRNMGYANNSGANVLVEGLPGAGKTAVVEAWCRKNGLILVALNATDPKIETAINGMPLRDVAKNDENAVIYAYAKEKFAPLLDPANTGKCVLFVDELNRQKTVSLRRPFMSLFNEKRNADGTLDFRKTLLFSVVCINPFGPKFHDQGVGELIPAEVNRFLFKHLGSEHGIDSKPEEAVSFWEGWTALKLLDLGIIPPGSQASKNHEGYVGPTRDLTADELEFAQSLVRTLVLAKEILYHEAFSFSTRDDAEDIYNQKADYLTSRSLTDALNFSQGDPKLFLQWVDTYGNLTTSTTEMFHDILDDYIMDTNAIYKYYGLLSTANGTNSVDMSISSATSASTDDVDDEDDDSLFGTLPASGAKIAKSAAATEQEIINAIDAW